VRNTGSVQRPKEAGTGFWWRENLKALQSQTQQGLAKYVVETSWSCQETDLDGREDPRNRKESTICLSPQTHNCIVYSASTQNGSIAFVPIVLPPNSVISYALSTADVYIMDLCPPHGIRRPGLGIHECCWSCLYTGSHR
jgi:hypothetical protein